MTSSGRWSDLALRLVSAVILLGIGLVAMWQGGLVFRALIAVACAAMLWELVTIFEPRDRRVTLVVGALAGMALLVAPVLPPLPALAGLAVPLALGWRVVLRDPGLFAAYGAMILLAGLALVAVRDQVGFLWLLWLVAVVVATDVGGYFGGRLLGGPKFWPKVSPKKTWAGILTGWGAAALIGALFGIRSGVLPGVVMLSVVLSAVSQMGDIAESALKRRAGVKDSSALIPGHGGVLDRFDGMAAAALMLGLFALVTGFPPGLR